MTESKIDNDFVRSPFGDDDSHWQFNACIGPNGGPYNYLDYARGYLHAGHAIAEDIIKKRIGVDILIYPLMYSYRHSLELTLKHFLLSAGKRVHSHDLSVLWKNTRFILNDLVPHRENDSLFILEDVIDNFCKVDLNGEAFRFPEGRDKNLFLQEMRIINILPVYRKMKKVEDAIEFLYYRQCSKLEVIEKD